MFVSQTDRSFPSQYIKRGKSLAIFLFNFCKSNTAEIWPPDLRLGALSAPDSHVNNY